MRPHVESTRAVWLWAPVVVYMAFIFGLVLDLAAAGPAGGDVGQDWTHGCCTPACRALLVRALAGGWCGARDAWVACLAVVIATVYGVTDEIHQTSCPPRQTDAWDLAADAAGASLAALGAMRCTRFRV